ncbi:MAG: hypothetical protein QM504_11950 [Pseudomonadota bacterium]
MEKKHSVTRLVRLRASSEQSITQDLIEFNEYLNVPNLILLGDPGSGKTYLFDKGCEYEQGEYFTARAFTISACESSQGKIIYIDALDEKRSRNEDQSSIEAIIALIYKIKPSKLRISCRAVDWLGDTDLELLLPYFNSNGGYRILNLESLSDEEIDGILTDNDISQPAVFRQEAERRGVRSLLNNPLTLIMLTKVINQNIWPKTKAELYQQASEILLKEDNKSHNRKQDTHQSMDDLLDAAGVISACVLMADIIGINLLNHTDDKDYPSYSSIPFDKSLVLSVLNKRIFICNTDEVVFFFHRTIAEYLAGKWLAKKIAQGFPINRLRFLIGLDGQPATELRGLHAWLTCFLPEHAPVLIKSDPYGVLTYGDPSCLSIANRNSLLKSLINLSETDPWFRNNDWDSDVLGGLSDQSMVDTFTDILIQHPDQYHLRSIVLDAIRYGPKLSGITTILEKIIWDDEAPYGERKSAYYALINKEPKNILKVATNIKQNTSKNSNTIRLCIAIIGESYNNNFDPKDVANIIEAYILDTNRNASGVLWNLPTQIIQNDLIEILDLTTDIINRNLNLDHENLYEIDSFYSSLINIIISNDDAIDPVRLWKWLKCLYSIRGRASNTSSSKEISAFLTRKHDLLLSLFKISLSQFKLDKHRNLFFHDFMSITFYTKFNIDQIINLFDSIKDNKTLSEKDTIIFEIVISQLFGMSPPRMDVFEDLIEFANKHPSISAIFDQSIQSTVHDWHLEEKKRLVNDQKTKVKNIEKNQIDFSHSCEVIKNGNNINWLKWLGKVYFAKFNDSKKDISPLDRLAQELGQSNSLIAIQGFKAALLRNDLPSIEYVGEHIAENSYFEWWYGILAGANETWKEELKLNVFSDRIISSVVAIDTILYTDNSIDYGNGFGWKEELFKNRPNLIQSVYLNIANICLMKKIEHIDVIYRLCKEDRLSNGRGNKLLSLLTKYPNSSEVNLRMMLCSVLSDPESKIELLNLSLSLLSQRSKVSGKKRELWYSVVFILSFEEFCKKGAAYFNNRVSAIWTIKKIIETLQQKEYGSIPLQLSTEQLLFLIPYIGKHFENRRQPTTSRGENNPWDASSFMCKLISMLSTHVDTLAVDGLFNLSKNKNLATFIDDIKHAHSSQLMLVRQHNYSTLNWEEIVQVFSNNKPIHTKDLHELTISHIRGLNDTIRFENNNIFKQFWNEDKGKITNPKVEDSCRDVLIGLMRNLFRPVNIQVEPEIHMVISKRADIGVYYNKMKIPLELKRDYHKDLWTACENQLKKLYVRDPGAKSYGIYVVFWFGNKRTTKIKRPPKHILMPTTPLELETALTSLISQEDRSKLEVIVIDVTQPDG